ncbi:hypothetical protein [Phyllobacterium chamaecytisi]|uniref:hypothetical protein n=1 Tax=Phyllobacterium chamaecytisi TaxID=2876082 RepID=UPI001CCF91B5|nr:hypothetical protein [Phyllobacterium sp. KW56]MBZ9601864.1 hypothetical protein [Phyllobacterium sp. KW56]
MFLHRTMPKPEGFGPNSPGPSGFRLAHTHFVRRLRPMNHIGLATFRVDCLAIRKTERHQYSLVSL